MAHVPAGAALRRRPAISLPLGQARRGVALETAQRCRLIDRGKAANAQGFARGRLAAAFIGLVFLRRDLLAAVFLNTELVVIIIAERRRFERLAEEEGAKQGVELVKPLRLWPEHGARSAVDVLHAARAKQADRFDETDRLFRRHREAMGTQQTRKSERTGALHAEGAGVMPRPRQ